MTRFAQWPGLPAEIIGAVGSLVHPVAASPYDGSQVVPAMTEVPLGYYEGVFARNERGRKQLIGWRYVGFMPLQACPTIANICRDEIVCSDDRIYALVFKGGTLCMQTIGNLKKTATSLPPCARYELPTQSVEQPVLSVPDEAETIGTGAEAR